MLRLFNSRWLLLASFLFPICVLGCGDSGPHLNNVSGTLTYQGKPVPNVQLSFIPADGRPSGGVTDSEGKFDRVMFSPERDGLLTGDYQVVISWQSLEPPASPIDPPPPPPAELRPLLKKYGKFDNPQIQVTIEKGQRTLDLNLD